jgi:hypothetical protein
MTGVVLFVFAVLLSACAPGQGPLAPHEWQGISQNSVRTESLRLVYTQYGDAILGFYFIGSATSPTGKAEGKIGDGTITMLLSPSSRCTYSFAGTITETRLIGSFVPESCTGGLAGTWDLIRTR